MPLNVPAWTWTSCWRNSRTPLMTTPFLGVIQLTTVHLPSRTPKQHLTVLISIQPAEAAPTPPEASWEQIIWASQVDPKELKTTRCAVFIILGRPYKNNIDRGKILRTIHATIQKLSKDPTNVDAISIIVAASDHTEFKKWAAASHYEDEHFHFGAVSQLNPRRSKTSTGTFWLLRMDVIEQTSAHRPSKP